MPEHDPTHALEAELAVFIERVRRDLEHGGDWKGSVGVWHLAHYRGNVTICRRLRRPS
jgi:hypothetical protein